ncbi:hypothetical protein [Microbacterium saperdae]|uniref:Uncharacterized protein n=1 Tax=Microbacterium saperdae TaxID=69368 RepID=A0A543BBJ5_9MICO|nr:hypothetical protein [Microbacterium saperdae]TQL82224.1 hypothetical protein FB560_3708 [Microbacterium saperdae]GGM38145.1 hypothetical protein GCM10010489_06420 [Microbacterium saperdae]
MKKKLYSYAALASVFLSIGLVAPAANAADQPDLLGPVPASQIQSRTVTTGDVTVGGCDAQIAKSLSATPDAIATAQEQICDGTVTIKEERFTVNKGEAVEIAADLRMTATETSSFVAKAAAGAVQGAKWSHAYMAVAVKEVHTGTTYWDGDKAWVGTYRGLTGKHVCHAEGGWQLAATVSNISCSKPGPSAKADSVERFDLHMVAKGFPIVFNVGLHNAYTNKGVRSTWQVGG